MRTPCCRIGAAGALLSPTPAPPLPSQPPSPTTSPSPAPPLTRAEARLRDWIAAHQEEQIGVLERLVNQPSGTLNMAGVRAAGALFAAELDGLGFTTKWIDMPAEMGPAGHPDPERPARKREKNGRRLLVIRHLDTVLEGEGQKFVRADSIARGAGSADMKGGDVILLYALKALAATGQLDAMDVTVVLTGDEEAAGRPLEISRRDLVAAAKRNDVALSFEGGSREFASITRRGASGWTLKVTARQAHSAGMFGGAGYGAIYEAARILTAFRDSIPREPGLTYNPGIIAGGAQVTGDTSGFAFQVAGKTNIIAPSAVVRGDLRFTTEEQKERTRIRMRALVARSLPGTSAEITFEDSYPAMPLTTAGEAVLAQYDTVSRALGYPAVKALDATRRGAGDLSFVAPYIPGIDGLGALGGGAPSPDEFVQLPSLEMQTARAALLMARLAGLRR